MWALILAFAGPTATGELSGEYEAVTETEYAIELKLEADGHARLDFRMWEADDSAPASNETFNGSWSRSGQIVELHFESGRSAQLEAVGCLSYSELGQAGCSPGLRLVRTTFPKSYGLERFGLWRSESLRIQP